MLSYYNKMDTEEIVSYLIQGEFVEVSQYFFNGLQLLEALNRELKKKFPKHDYKGRRQRRAAYREASHRLLLKIENHKLKPRKSPRIGWLKILYPEISDFYLSFPTIQGMNSSWQWYTKGLEIKALNLRIHPYYGVYFPTRFDHFFAFDQWLTNYNGKKNKAIDVGLGSGVLSFQLIQHGFKQVVGTDTNINAIIGALEEIERNNLSSKMSVIHGDLFANSPSKFDLVVFNPPWIPATHPLQEGIDKAIYYDENLFPRFFEQAGSFLEDDGTLVILFSNLGSVADKEFAHPIKSEIETEGRFKVDSFMQRKVKRGSSKTSRKTNRSKEKVELWALRKDE